MTLEVKILATIVLLGQLFLAGYLLSYLIEKYSDIEIPYFQDLNDLVYENRYYAAFIVSGLATLGSLYFSNIMGWEPCRLCWFQRIFMYPIFLLTGWSLVLGRRDIEDMILPLGVFGSGTALYHYAVQMMTAISSSCSTGGGCGQKFTFYFGYITIPLMALTAFLLVLAVLYIRKK